MPLAAAGLLFAGAAEALDIKLADTFGPTEGALDGTAEILSFTPDENTLLSTMAGSDGFGVQIMTLGADGSLSPRGIATFNDIFNDLGTTVDSASSTAVDPLQRGFGAVSLIPTDNGGTEGKVAFFDYSGSTGDTDRTLAVVNVGFHPDSVTFSADGSKLYVANEGEFTSGGDSDAPGSISVIDLSGIATLADFGGLGDGDVTTTDFSGEDLSGLRFNDLTFTPGNAYRHVEPEYVIEKDGKVFVSLQENNALAEFDPAAGTWSIQPLGTIEQLIDASDRDGGPDPDDPSELLPAAKIDDLVKGMPMPDAIAAFEVAGVTYLVTANEGDFRVDDGDRIRVKDLDPDNFSTDLENALIAQYGSVANALLDENLGRLRVQDLDGIADNPTQTEIYDDLLMPGTRSISIWNASTGELVGDTGSLEGLLLSLTPEMHNAQDGTPDEFDSRSDDKGPEPEALTVAEIDGDWIAFIGLERQNGLLAFNITDPANPFYVGYINSYLDGLVSPESLLYISAQDSPLGVRTLIAGYEVSGSIGVYVVPVPATLVLLATGVLAMRRRRR
jgi:hypothetical protein